MKPLTKARLRAGELHDLWRALSTRSADNPYHLSRPRPDNIKALRRLLNLSNAKLAELTGEEHRIVCMWQTGDRDPWPSVRPKLLDLVTNTLADAKKELLELEAEARQEKIHKKK